MTVERHEAHELLPLIQPFFEVLVDRYDENKYSPSVYESLVAQFEDHDAVGVHQIEAALCWKYGRPKPEKLAPAHRATIARLADRWHRIPWEGTPNAILAALSDPDQPAQDFVSRIFLIHLTMPDDVYIIDRYNYRAARWLLGRVRRGFPLLGLPRHLGHHDLVKCFIDSVIEAWGDTAPHRQKMDRFLMMFGKHVAPSFNRRRRVDAGQ